MSIQYREKAGQWVTIGYSMRPRDALKHIMKALEAAEAADDLDAVRAHLKTIREKTELGLAYETRAKRPKA